MGKLTRHLIGLLFDVLTNTERNPPHCVTALPTTYSMVSSLALSILTFAGMQVFKDELSTEGRMTILGGFLGSWFFVFFVTVSMVGFI